MTTITVMAFDPGFASLGWAWLEFSASHSKVLRCGTYIPPAGEDEARLNYVADFVMTWDAPTLVAYENQAGMFAGKALAEGQGGNYYSRRLLEVCGMLRALAARHEVPCLTVMPSTAKKALTGSGKADKHQVSEACRVRFGVYGPDQHATDAIAVGVAALAKYRTLQARIGARGENGQ